MITTEQIIYIILFLLLSAGIIFLWIRKKRNRLNKKPEIKRKVPETIEELFEEYEEPEPEYEEPEPEPEIKKKKPKKPVSLLDQDFEF